MYAPLRLDKITMLFVKTDPDFSVCSPIFVHLKIRLLIVDFKRFLEYGCHAHAFSPNLNQSLATAF